MLDRIITWSLEHRLVVCVLAVVMIGVGVRSMMNLPIDAYPDTTPVQVQVNVKAPALSAEEIEEQVTFAVEQSISGVPGLREVRSISKYGLSQTVVIFEDGTDIWHARQMVGERLETVSLPAGIDPPAMGPVATGLGEVYHYVVRSDDHSLEELTTIHDWHIKPRLVSVPGVAEVNTWGGERRQYQVRIRPERLLSLELTVDDVARALRLNNLNVGGGYVTEGGEMQVLRGLGLTRTTDEIGSVVIDSHEGRPVRVRDVARVEVGHELRRGAATANGEGEVVLGLAFMLMGENSHEVTARLVERMEEIGEGLPEGVRVEPLYVRTELVDRVIETVQENLLEGAILVVAILFIFLGNLRAGLIVASAIPLSMLFAFTGMLELGIAGSLMSLGAIDFGLIVDSSVIQVENVVHHVEEAEPDRPLIDVVREAALEVRRPTMFGELIILIVYLPVLTLEGVEGKLFRPMAITVVLALAGSLVLSLTLVPVLSSLLIRRGKKTKKNRLVRWVQGLYRPVVRTAIRGRPWVLGAALALLGVGLGLASRTGAEFIPRLSEMGIVVNTVRLSGVSLDESVRFGSRMEEAILDEFPDEVEDVWVRTGTAEVATDPMGIELSDVFITLTPRAEWTRATTQAELTAALRDELSDLPGTRLIFTQPIEMRVNEMIAGIRSDLGVKIFGDDLDRLGDLADEVASVLETTEGGADVYREQITGLPVLEVEVDRDAIAREGVPARHVLELVEAVGGTPVGEVREGQRRFELTIRLPERFRHDARSLRDLLVPTVDGEVVPIARLATIREVEGPSTVTREWQRRRIVVQCNVEDRDVAGFVEEVRERVDAEVDLPPGYHVAYGGQFEHYERARNRLWLVVPLALGLILFLLHASTGSVVDTLVIFTGAPFATLGGIVALHLREMPFTISAGVGFVAVSGVAMLNGLVMLSTIRQLIDEGNPLLEAVEEGCVRRLRPVLMTALVAGLGFVPMALNTGVGAEVQRPLATVVVGGVVSDALLTLVVLPALYSVVGHLHPAQG